jgi:hypothetical protein
MKRTTHLQSAPSLIMRGAIHLLPCMSCMTWCWGARAGSGLGFGYHVLTFRLLLRDKVK